MQTLSGLLDWKLDPLVRLLDIVHNDVKLYLIFEFLDLDLKKYMDTTAPHGLPPKLIKVRDFF
jgi:hypothetical protein